MKAIIVEIGTDGSVRMAGQGFTGKSCDVLGIVTERKHQPEYFQQEVTSHVLRTRA